MYDIDFAFVSVLYYEAWPKIMLRSLRDYCNSEVILVNHLHHDVPEEYKDDKCTILEMGHNPSHGAGIDLAIDHLRNRGVKYCVLMEPDCVILGDSWLHNMINAIKNGAIMAGPSRLPFGPIHPCPSIWDINRISGSFQVTNRDIDIDLSIFNYVEMIKWLHTNQFDETSIWLWCHKWDCGIKNWYMAATQGLAVETVNNGDFKHFYNGRTLRPMDLAEEDFMLIVKYI